MSDIKDVYSKYFNAMRIYKKEGDRGELLIPKRIVDAFDLDHKDCLQVTIQHKEKTYVIENKVYNTANDRWRININKNELSDMNFKPPKYVRVKIQRKED